MITYLQNHFRYYTMNSWNKSTSYARNVKIYNLGLTREQENEALELLEAHGAFDRINDIIHDFDTRHDYKYQMGYNGRSQGYIVLYQGGKQYPGYKTQCDACGKLTWYETEQACKMNGCSGTLTLLKTPVFRVFSQPGMGIDMEQDFEDWDDDSLRSRYELIKDFDATIDECIKAFKDLIDACRVVEKTVMIPTKVKVLECADEAS